MSDRPQPEFDRYADRYESDLRASMPPAFLEDRYFAEYKVLYVTRRLRVRKPPAVLDFGCGIGRSLTLFGEHLPGAELWGFDVSPESIRMAQERAPGARVTSDLHDLPEGRFDVVFAANVFHHIPLSERLNALRACARLLSREGSVFLFEHNPLNPVTSHVFERCPFDEGAIMLPRKESLELARAAGLRVAHRAYTLFFPRPLAVLRPLEKVLAWLPLGAQYCLELKK